METNAQANPYHSPHSQAKTTMTWLSRAFVCALWALVLVFPTVGWAKSAKHTCLMPSLCLGMNYQRAVKSFLQRKYLPQKQLSPLVCRFYMPKQAPAQQWQCTILQKQKHKAYLVGYRGRLVYAFVALSANMPTIAQLRQKWGAPFRILRSLEGTSVFWETASPTRITGALLPYLTKPMPIAQRRPAGIYTFDKKRLESTMFASNFGSIRDIYRRQPSSMSLWPLQCFHTLCLGSSRKHVLALLQSQGYKPISQKNFKNCKSLFSGGTSGQLRCLNLRQTWSHAVVRLVWRKDQLIFAQGEQLASPINVQRLRWIWGQESQQIWAKGMLFLRWTRPNDPHHILLTPLYGEQHSKQPIAQRKCVGFLLLDWSQLQSTRMGKVLSGLLKL